MEEHEIKIKTLTPLWTGDINGECSRIKETGIIGSLRWWYEALVRGLGGYACDPNDSNCQFNYEAYKESGDVEDGFTWKNHSERNVCDVCKLFGCNGWEKRFRLEVEAKGDFDKNIGYEENQELTIKINFIYQPRKENKWLLWQTLNLISEYGAIGGKTKLKPSNTPKDKPYSFYNDYGIIKVIWEESSFELPDISKEEVKENLQNPLEQSNKLPNLKFFFFSREKNLDSSQYDRLENYKDFYNGNRGDKSNKFATYKNKDRFWGYTKQDDEMYKKTKEKLDELGIPEEKTTEGSSILENMGGDQK